MRRTLCFLACAAPAAALAAVGRRAALGGAAALVGATQPSGAARTGDLASALLGAPGRTWRDDAPRAACSASGWDLTPLADADIAARAARLPPLSQRVALEADTERPFTGQALPLAAGGVSPGYKSEAVGVYVSAVSGLPLFSSGAKYDSGTGWPSFFVPFDAAHVIERADPGDAGLPASFRRTEVLDAKTGAHVGHVFPDGPPPTGMRYCLNAAALVFVPESEWRAFAVAGRCSV
ncbi:Mss4-like protein [Pelagophyceae sp. CCMP2097]|nr:Mss4-like protein [Pelagophyceae sp. CCMP2097]